MLLIASIVLLIVERSSTETHAVVVGTYDNLTYITPTNVSADNNIYQSSASYFGSQKTATFTIAQYTQSKAGASPTKGENATFSATNSWNMGDVTYA